MKLTIRIEGVARSSRTKVSNGPLSYEQDWSVDITEPVSLEVETHDYDSLLSLVEEFLACNGPGAIGGDRATMPETVRERGLREAAEVEMQTEHDNAVRLQGYLARSDRRCAVRDRVNAELVSSLSEAVAVARALEHMLAGSGKRWPPRLRNRLRLVAATAKAALDTSPEEGFIPVD